LQNKHLGATSISNSGWNIVGVLGFAVSFMGLAKQKTLPHTSLAADLKPFSSLAKLLYNNSIKQGTLPQSNNQQLSRKINFAETQTSIFPNYHPISRYDKLSIFN
jgi:hypothetical protein